MMKFPASEVYIPNGVVQNDAFHALSTFLPNESSRPQQNQRGSSGYLFDPDLAPTRHPPSDLFSG